MYKNLQYLELEVNSNITVGQLDIALNLIIEFVENIVEDSRATAKVFGSSRLDNLCQQIGAEALKLQKKSLNQQIDTTAPQKNVIFYIATELSNMGGHSAVVEDFIRAEPQKKHSIIITNTLGTAQREIIEDRFAQIAVEIEWAPSTNTLDKLIWLQSLLLEKQPTQIFLFNHWQDAVAIAAVVPSLTPQLIFYHHCDHQLCLGLYLSHAQHIDPHSFGFYNCRDRLGVANTIYIPLTVNDLGQHPDNFRFLGDGNLRTCSSGSGHKFEQSYLYSYMKEVPKILEITGGVHLHIGRLSPHSLNEIRQGLQEREIPSERFVYIPWVKSVWRAMHEHRIDLYISSFPLGGGKASVEVMGSGTPIIGHQNYHSRLLSAIDIIYPEAFFWQNPEQLYSYLKNLTPEILLEQAAFSRKYYELYHTPQILKQCLDKLSVKENYLFPLPQKKYCTDDLQAFLETSTLDVSKKLIDIVDAIYPILDESKFSLDKNKVSEFLYWLTMSEVELKRSHSQLQQTQTELEKSQYQFQNSQTQLQRLQSQLQKKQAELESLQFQLQQTQAELESLQSQLQQTQAELEHSQLQLQQKQLELERLQFQLQQKQVKLERLRSQLQQTQAELERLRSQLQQTQVELERSQSQEQQIQVELKRSQFQEQKIQTELEQVQFQVQQKRAEVDLLQKNLEAMETSKFWKLRKAWFRLKRLAGLIADE